MVPRFQWLRPNRLRFLLLVVMTCILLLLVFFSCTAIAASAQCYRPPTSPGAGGDPGGGYEPPAAPPGSTTGTGERDQGSGLGNVGDSFGCFAGWEQVLTPSGTVPISSINAGDVVVSYDEASDQFVTSIVGHVLVHDGVQEPVHDFSSHPLLAVTVSDDMGTSTTKVTANHPYYDPVSNTYRPISEFQLGDAVRTTAGVGTIVSLEPSPLSGAGGEDPTIVYNLHMQAGPQNFVVNGVVVHNVK